jgi:4-oxalocrotonate tautomerase
MPVVRVAFYEGRSVEKKRAIAEAITDALVRIGGSTRAGVHVIFENIARENWVIGGAPELGDRSPRDRATGA